MEHAKVVIIEDNKAMREFVRSILADQGHEITYEATTLPQALAAVEDIGDGEIEANVIVLDGNLSETSRHGSDARQIFGRIQERGISAYVIGFSADDMNTMGVEVHFDSRKDPFAVAKAIDRL